MKPAYYNEIDKFAAHWLRNLISAGLIAPGDVDERSIVDVRATDLVGYGQCHFFAGIGGWSYALRLAGVPDDESIWTGSCPCQPLSVAGQRKGHVDERHLWPAFYNLIAEHKPATVFGEQVASKDGREWLAGIRHDLEDLGYACGAANLPAASVGAPHKRERLWWVAANADCLGLEGRPLRARSSPPCFRHEEFARLVADEIQLSVPTGKHHALSHGVPNRVGCSRDYGNAIVPQLAAEFIGAYMNALALLSETGSEAA